VGYATKQNMIDRFGSEELIQLTDRNNTGAIDDVVLGQALADADTKIDGYLGTRYTLPLATVPPSLTPIACDIARYNLYDKHATEEVRNRYKDAEGFLKLLAKGEVTLGPDPVDTEGAGSPQYTAPAREFTKDTLGDF
jgi:phage gp36-like protein